MAKDDFFLSFGTDADIFASKIETESGRASQAILHLTEALEDYDATVKNAKAGGPLQNLFASLDDAASKFGTLSNQLVQGFSKTLEGVGELTAELSGLVDAVNKINELAPSKKRKIAENVNAITNEDVVATNDARRAGKALGEIIEINATQARNALKRVADINATVGRNSNDAADGVKELAKQIRELSGAAKEAKGRGTIGQVAGGGGQIIVVANGGVVAGAAGAPVNLQSIVDDALKAASSNGPKVADEPVPTDQAADALVSRRASKIVPITDLESVAKPGRYSHEQYPGRNAYERNKGRIVGNDVRPNETFEQYFKRNDAVNSVIEEARSGLVGPSRDDLALYRKFKSTGGSEANDLFERQLKSGAFGPSGKNNFEDVKASFSGIKFGALKAHEIDQIPGLLQRLAEVREHQQQVAKETIEHLLKVDPYATFGGGAFGAQNIDTEIGNTFPAALHRVDEAIVSRGAERREVARDEAGNILNASLAGAELRASSRTTFSRNESAVDASRLVDPNTVATEEQEGLTARGVAKDNARRRKEARERNKALVAGLDDIDQASVRARRVANPELQRINSSLSKKSLNLGEIAEALGLQSESYRVPATDPAKFERQALLREQAQTRLEALNVDPEKYAALHGTTPGELRKQLQETIAGATASITDQTTRSRVLGVTDSSQAEARAVLEARRAEILAQTATPLVRPEPLQSPEDANTRTVYRGSREPLDPKRITPEGLRVTQDRSYAEEHGGDQYLYKAQIPASHFRVSDFTDEEEQHARLSAEDFAKYQFEQIVGPETANTGNPKKVRQPRNKGALVTARELLKDLTAQVAATTEEDQSLLGALAAAQAEVDRLSQARVPKEAAAEEAGAPKTATGGAGAPPPPRKPRNAAAASDDGDLFGQDLGKKKNQSTAGLFTRDFSAQIALLQESTKAQLADYAARLKDTQAITDQTEKLAAQRRILLEAAAVFKGDPLFKQIPDLTTKKGTFAEALGIPGSTKNNATVTQLFTQGGALSASGLTNNATSAANAPGKAQGARDEGGTLGRALFGNRGFIDSQLRHIGSAIENFAGFQLAFTGFEKLKELVDTGIQADAAFVRLQASLTATGRNVGALRTQLQSVSSGTATGLKDTIDAASELSGVFKNNADLVAGTRIATQLANISEGALTAKESAVGLRDVIDAYGLTGQASVKKVGDQIARLSQVTGVSVKDVLEGTTKLAQVGRQYNLTQPQAATFAAFVTRNTGETGEAAAEQVDRIFSTLDSGKVQKALTTIRTKDGKPLATPQQFAAGKQGDILTNLLAQFDNLDPANQAEIRDLVSRGRQAPAFAGFIRDGKLISEQASAVESGSDGALERQNKAYLDTLAGQLKVLSTDFKNLGSSLAQSGVFDIIGLLAKGLDDVLKITTGILNTFNALANSNPFTKAIREIAVLGGEIALLFKLFGPGAGQLLGRIRPGRATRDVVDRSGAIVRDAEGVAQQEFVPVTARGLGRGIISTPGRIFRGSTGFISNVGNNLGGFLAGSGAGRQGADGVPYFIGPGGNTIAASELSGSQRFALARNARAERVLNGSGLRGALTRGLANNGAVGLAGVTNGLATATTGVVSNVGNATKALGKLGGSFLGPLAAMAAFGLAVDVVANSFKRSSEIGAAANALADDLRGKNATNNANDAAGKNADGTDKSEANDILSKAVKARDKANNPGFIDGVRKGLIDPLQDPNSSGNFIGTYSSDNGFDRNETATNNLLNKRLRHANAETDPKKRADALKKALEQGENDIKGEQSFIDSLGLNNEQKANAEADLGLMRQAFEKSYAKLLANAQGLNQQDVLNIQQGENVLAALNAGSALKSETLRGDEGKRTKQAILDDSTAPVGSQAYKDLSAALDGDSTRARLVAQTAGDEDLRKNALNILDTGAKSGPERERNRKLLDAADAKLQADQAALRSLDQNNPLALSQIAEGKGDTKGAIANQKKAIAALEDANKQIGNKDDPEYIANLKKIQDEKKTLADLTFEGSILAAAAAASATNDPLLKAQAEYQKAVAEQKSVLSRDHTPAEAQQAQSAVDTTNIAQQQAAEDLKSAQFQASIAGFVDNTALTQQKINENLRQQKKYGDGTLASQIKLTQLKGEEATLRQQLLTGTQDSANAEIERQIAVLDARGAAGDAEKAANLGVTEAKNKLAQYLKKPGAKATDATAKGLQAAVVTAQRNAFDVALNAQIDTLDFQKETYKITSSQEVQALQEILKNKQLTLKEQRDITLKIKNLQDSVRQQLTGGGFNIPTDIKLPTAFQVRRSLGGGFGNGGSNTTVNNVATNTVAINNNVPTAAVAHAIANQVIAVINAQTGQSARANTSTPRLVGP